MKISICAITYRRFAGLKKLLLSFQNLIVPTDVQLEFIIVDNDPEGSAGEVFEQVPLENAHFHIEKEKGIPFARNRAMAETDKESKYICFVDDDEWVHPYWIVDFCDTADEKKADVVTGPVIPVFNDSIPQHFIDGHFFERMRFPHNKRIKFGKTSNVMISKEFLNQNNLCFDEELRYTGGTDTLLFMQLIRLGGKIYWCDKAMVFEDVPTSRGNWKWVLQRSYRFGNTLSICDVKLKLTFKKLAMRLAKSGGRIVIGLVTLPFAWSKIRLIKSLQSIAKGFGMLAGLMNRRFEEYKS